MNLSQITYLVVMVAWLSGLVPLFIILMRIRDLPVEYKWLAVYFALSFLCDAAGRILYANDINPNYAANVYVFLNLIPFTFFYSYATRRRLMSPSLVVINIFFIVFCSMNLLFIQKFGINSYTFILNSLIILVLSILFFYRLLKDLPTEHVMALPLFWIMSAFFFSQSGKLVIFSVTNYMVEYLKDNLAIVWTFHNFLTIIANVLISYGLWLKHKQLRSTSLSQ
jgi:hypothetical protein